MAKELRNVVAFQEQQAATAHAGPLTKEEAEYYEKLYALINEGEAVGHLAPSLPSGSRLVIAQAKGDSLSIEGREIVLPERSPELVEVHRILTDSGFTIAPIAYIDRKKGEVTHAVIETIARPDYANNGIQMYYDNPDEDPVAKFVEAGRALGRKSEGQGIATPRWAEQADRRTRFFIAWDEAHGFLAPAVVSGTPHLAEQITKGGIVLRVPTLAEFRFAGQTHDLVANSWEWVHDSAGFGRRHVAGYRDDGGLKAVDDLLSVNHSGRVGLRFQAVSHPQRLPR